MIDVKKLPDGGLRIDGPPVKLRVYLDHGAISDLAKQPEIGERFKSTLLNVGGTLCLSSVHLLELYGLGPGPTHEKIKAFLASFGRNFFLFDCDLDAVTNREKNWTSGKPDPALDVELFTALAANWDETINFSFTVLLDTLDQDAALVKRLKNLHRTHKDELYQIFAKKRQDYRSDPQVKKQLDEAQYHYEKGTPPTQYLIYELGRQIIRTQEEIEESIVIDFQHAVVSLGYADYVVLDRQWVGWLTNRLKNRLPSNIAKVWKIGQLSKLIDKLEQIKGSPM